MTIIELSARRLIRNLALLIVTVLIGAFVLFQCWCFGWVAYWSSQNPHRTAFMSSELQRLQRARPGAVLQHQWVPYERIAADLKRAVIAAEDARFLEHDGLDWDALSKAYQHNQSQKSSRSIRGGSTISQQLAKNLFLSADRTWARKLQEVLITMMIEALWDKRRILEVYLNVAQWGEGVFGAEAGARHYFGVAAAHIGPEAAARMAAMLPRPRFFDRNRNVPFLATRSAWIQRNAERVRIP